VAGNQTIQATTIACTGVSKFFGAIRALDDVAMELKPGVVTALVGDNGAGKSTLVKVLSGLHQPDEGLITVGNEEFRGYDVDQARRLGIETIYQSLELCNKLSASENVVLGREPLRWRIGGLGWINRSESRAIARREVEGVGGTVEDFDSAIETFSGGQRQAIAIARAVHRAQRLVVFDEPTAALGVRQTRATLDVIRRVASQGLAVLLISHSLDDVFEVADRVVALRLGRVSLDAAIDETDRREVLDVMSGLAGGS
jgi:simple sugar transport system ATP-binding protein